MANGMTDIEMKDFTSVTGVNDGDSIVLVLKGGEGGKIGIALFKAAVTADIKPSISDGYWWVGSVNTGVEAAGKTPEFRKSTLGIEWRYITEADSAWRLLVNFSDIRFRFEELTAAQQESLKLKFSDLTAVEIAELQKPAADMITKLQTTNDTADAAEKLRIVAERERVTREQSRTEKETQRITAESVRGGNETTRMDNELKRVAAESARVTEFTRLKEESETATADATSQAEYAKEVGDAVKNGHITITEAAYNALVNAGTVNPEIFYYIIEEE